MTRDTTLFSKTSSKSSQLEEHDQPDYATYGPDYFNTWKGEVRAVTQTQTGALENSTESELRAMLALLAKDKAEYRRGSINGLSHINNLKQNGSPAANFIHARIG
jgi:hypothetical protein